MLREAGAALAGGPGRVLLAQEEVGDAEEVPPPLRWPPQDPPRILLWARNLTVAYKGQEVDLTARTFGEGATVDLGGSSWDPQEARSVWGEHGGAFKWRWELFLGGATGLWGVGGALRREVGWLQGRPGRTGGVFWGVWGVLGTFWGPPSSFWCVRPLQAGAEVQRCFWGDAEHHVSGGGRGGRGF